MTAHGMHRTPPTAVGHWPGVDQADMATQMRDPRPDDARPAEPRGPTADAQEHAPQHHRPPRPSVHSQPRPRTATWAGTHPPTGLPVLGSVPRGSAHPAGVVPCLGRPHPLSRNHRPHRANTGLQLIWGQLPTPTPRVAGPSIRSRPTPRDAPPCSQAYGPACRPIPVRRAHPPEPAQEQASTRPTPRP